MQQFGLWGWLWVEREPWRSSSLEDSYPLTFTQLVIDICGSIICASCLGKINISSFHSFIHPVICQELSYFDLASSNFILLLSPFNCISFLDDMNWGRQILSGWEGEAIKGKRDHMRNILRPFQFWYNYFYGLI